jgi:cob(I)alamin adenosyltransferase
MTTKQKLAIAAKRAVVRARIVGKRAAKQLIEAADEALIAQGKAARARQRKRAFKAALKKIGKTVVIAGTAAATVLAARAAARRAERRATVSK